MVAQTRATVPTSDEINCAKCHLPGPANNNDSFLDILQKHGSDGMATACNVCHTAITATSPNKWPHQFQWHNR